MFLLFVLSVMITYMGYQMITTVVPRFLLVTPQLWQEKIQKVITHPKNIYLKVGGKRSAYRRRLVLASCQPSFYTNYAGNNLIIHPEDKKNEGNKFTDTMKVRGINDPNRKLLYGFFHPYANNGGGGEKVLWQAVKATLDASDGNVVVVYTVSNDVAPKAILQKAEEKFDIANLDSKRIVFIYLRKFNKLIDSAYWKHFTLLGQFFGSFLLGGEALFELTPDVWIDTIGLPGANWLPSVSLKIPIVNYVHYPVIQPEMFAKLKFSSFKDISKIKPTHLGDWLQLGKFVYWKLMYHLYQYLGSTVHLTLTNGTWTLQHMQSIWYYNKFMASHTIDMLYPPCGTENLTVESSSTPRENKLLYIAQFRPEKRHDLIVDQYKVFLDKAIAAKTKATLIPSVVFAGSCRTEDDTATLDALKNKVDELNLNEYFEFVVDAPYLEISSLLSTCSYGLNAMWNEHFGIGVVEYMAKGVIPIVHASAGPLLDIVTGEKTDPEIAWKNSTGFFFKSETDPDVDLDLQKDAPDGFIAYSEGSYPVLLKLLYETFVASPLSDLEVAAMRLNCVELVGDKFSNKTFLTLWAACMNVTEVLERQFRDHLREPVEAVY